VRGKRGQLLLGLGTFLLVLAFLMRFHAYPRLAVAPIDQNSESTLVGPDATIFDIATLSEVQTDLTTRARTVGDIEASEDEGGGARVWVNTSSTTDSEGVVRSRSVERVAFDAHTGEGIDCCDTYYEGTEGEPTPTTYEGLVYKFPFRTEKKTYDWWDGELLEALPIEYQGTEEIAGYETYVFEHTIDPTVTGTTEVPASLVGEQGDGTVEAELVYSNVRTLWVEPSTGVVLKRTEAQDNYLQYDGERQVTTSQVNTGFTEETTQEFADEYGGLGTLLNLLYLVLPVSFLVLGVVLIGLGVWLYRKDRRPPAQHA